MPLFPKQGQFVEWKKITTCGPILLHTLEKNFCENSVHKYNSAQRQRIDKGIIRPLRPIRNSLCSASTV